MNRFQCRRIAFSVRDGQVAGNPVCFVHLIPWPHEPHRRHRRRFWTGRTEQAIHEVGFPEEHIFRPGFLVGPRRGTRWNEKIALPILRALSVALVGRLSQYRAIAARDVARAMVRVGAAPDPGTHVYHWRETLELAGSYQSRSEMLTPNPKG